MKPTLEPSSLSGRVQVWFEANPDEELTSWDVAVKFDVPLRSVYPELSQHPRYFNVRVGESGLAVWSKA